MPVLHDKKSRVSQLFDEKSPILEVGDLSFSYPAGHCALDQISITLQPGEKVALVGHNGSGKSTLMLNIIGILTGEGSIKVSGMDLTEDNLPFIRAKVGLVFQNPDDQLFSPTVFEDVAFGPLHMGISEEETRIRVANALKAVGMEKFEDRLSYHLSTGEKKRVAIATVLSMEPDLIILDEPSAGLDPRARRSLINLLRDLPQSLLVATHDLLMVRELLPRTVILDSGQVVADGPTDLLLADKDLLDKHGLELPI
ncbi:MAG: ABC transporter ATP-binding protein [Anaerolineales bacterium]